MTFSIKIALLTIKQLFKSKSFLFIVLMFPLFISGLITVGVQNAYEPAVSYFNKAENQKDFIAACTKSTHDSVSIFKNESEIYPTVKDEMEKAGINRELPELAKLATENFLKVLIPPLFPKIKTIISESKMVVLQILLMIASLLWLPAFLGVFLLNTENKAIQISLFAKGISSFEYVIGKIIAGMILALMVTVLSLIGMTIGFQLTPSAVANEGLMLLLINFSIVCVSGVFCAILISFLITILFSEMKTQVLVSIILTPLLVLFIYFFSLKDMAFQSSMQLIQTEFSSIKTERIPIDKNEVDLMMERQVLNYAQMFAVKIGSDLIPRAVKRIPVNESNSNLNTNISTFNSFLLISLVCIGLSLTLSIVKFKAE